MTFLFKEIKHHLRGRSATGLFMALISASVSRLGLLALAVLISRQFGPSGYGVFSFATGLAMFGSQVVSLGWPNLMSRLIPEFRAGKQWGLLRGFLRAGAVTVLLTSVTASLLLLAAASMFPKLSEGLTLASVLLPPMAFVILRRQQLAAVGKPGMGVFFDQGFGAILASLALLALGVSSVPTAVLVYAAALILGLVITTVVFHRSLPGEHASDGVAYRYRHWMVLAVPIMIGLASRQMLFRTDILLLAPLSSIDQVGLYGAAFRLTYLFTFPQAVLMLVMTPKFADALARGDTPRVRRLLKATYTFVTATSVPIVALLALFPGEAMVLVYGDSFAEGAAVLVFLALGQFGASLAIPTQALLTMGGQERPFAVFNLLVFGLNVILCLFIIPRYGALGAALCTALSVWLQLLAQVLLSTRMLRNRS